MTNREMAAVLFNIATLLRDREDNPYRIRAYERGARALMGRRDETAALLVSGDRPLTRRKGVLGDRMQRKLRELTTTGKMAYLEDLCADLPPHMGALMQVPGVGPRTARHLHDALGIETPAELIEAARSGRLRTLWGFGPKREAQMAQLSLFDDSHEAPRALAA